MEHRVLALRELRLKTGFEVLFLLTFPSYFVPCLSVPERKQVSVSTPVLVWAAACPSLPARGATGLPLFRKLSQDYSPKPLCTSPNSPSSLVPFQRELSEWKGSVCRYYAENAESVSFFLQISYYLTSVCIISRYL